MEKRPDLSTREKAFEVTLNALRETHDEVALVLRGHLIVEAMLWAYIERTVPNPASLSDSRLSFRQVLRVAWALRDPSKDSWLWPALEKLNSIRNELAHSIMPGDYAKKREAFLQATETHIETPCGLDDRQHLRMVLVILCGVLFHLDSAEG